MNVRAWAAKSPRFWRHVPIAACIIRQDRDRFKRLLVEDNRQAAAKRKQHPEASIPDVPALRRAAAA